MGKTSAFVVGSLLGAGVALLLAPRTGAETRAMVGDAAASFLNTAPEGEGNVSVKEAWDNAFAKGEELFSKGRAVVTDIAGDAYTKVADVAGDTYTKVADFAGETFVKASDAATVAVSKAQETIAKAAVKAKGVVTEEAAPVFTENDDELRAKMEVARQRIAEQIAKNAAEAKARAEAVVATVAKEAAEAVEAVADAVETAGTQAK